MNRNLIDAAHKLQEALNALDANADSASLIWADGFLSGLLASLRSRVPELSPSNSAETAPAPASITQLHQEISHSLDDLEKRTHRGLKGLSRRTLKQLQELQLASGRPDSLERLLDELDGSGPAETSGVPAALKPGPKGLSGGVALSRAHIQ